MSATNSQAYVSPHEGEIAPQEEAIKLRAEIVDSWVVANDYPSAEVGEFYYASLDLEKGYKKLVQSMSKDRNYRNELIRFVAIRDENLRHISILAPICAKRPPSPTGRTALLIKELQQADSADSNNSSCCVLL